MKIVKSDPLLRHHYFGDRVALLDRLFYRSRTEDGLNQKMFEEDFSSIFRYDGHRSENLFSITSGDAALTNELLSGVRTNYERDSIGEIVREWVEEVAGSLVHSGRAYYYLSEGEESQECLISPVGPDGIFRIFGFPIQWVPKHVDQRWDREDEEVPREARILDAAKLLSFTLPTAIKRMLTAQKRTLTVLDKHQYRVDVFQPKPTHEDPIPTTNFDFGVWRDTQERAFYRSTRVTGWNGRKYDYTKRSDFFDCFRLIRFRRNQLVLRDDILNQISKELSRLGRKRNARYVLTISPSDALPTVAYLNELETRLVCEQAGFNEVLDYCLQR